MKIIKHNNGNNNTHIIHSKFKKEIKKILKTNHNIDKNDTHAISYEIVPIL